MVEKDPHPHQEFINLIVTNLVVSGVDKKPASAIARKLVEFGYFGCINITSLKKEILRANRPNSATIDKRVWRIGEGPQGESEKLGQEQSKMIFDMLGIEPVDLE